MPLCDARAPHAFCKNNSYSPTRPEVVHNKFNILPISSSLHADHMGAPLQMVLAYTIVSTRAYCL